MQVEDPVKAVINVDDYSGSAQALAATTLRKVLCGGCVCVCGDIICGGGIVCGGGGSSGSGGGGGGAGQECNWIVFSLFCTLDNGRTNKLVSVNGFNFIFIFFDRNVLGTRSLGEILSDRVTFSSIHHIDCLSSP